MNLVDIVKGLNYLYGDYLLKMKISKIEIGEASVFIYHEDCVSQIPFDFLQNKIEVVEND